VIPEQLALLLMKQKNHNKRFGELEFEYFGGSDVANKLFHKSQLEDEGFKEELLNLPLKASYSIGDLANRFNASWRMYFVLVTFINVCEKTGFGSAS
jgi:hypothetical protein